MGHLSTPISRPDISQQLMGPFTEGFQLWSFVVKSMPVSCILFYSQRMEKIWNCISNPLICKKCQSNYFIGNLGSIVYYYQLLSISIPFFRFTNRLKFSDAVFRFFFLFPLLLLLFLIINMWIFVFPYKLPHLDDFVRKT